VSEGQALNRLASFSAMFLATHPSRQASQATGDSLSELSGCPADLNATTYPRLFFPLGHRLSVMGWGACARWQASDRRDT